MCPMHGVDVGHSSPENKAFSPAYGAVEKTRKTSEKPGFADFLCPTRLPDMVLCIKGLAVGCPTTVGKMFHSFRRLLITWKGGDASDQ
jgi:hypothetical protein